MQLEKLLKKASKIADRYRVTDGKGFRLKDVDPADTAWFKDAAKSAAKKELEEDMEALTSLQDMLYAGRSWSLLLIFQAMDAAGKDSAIKHVMSGINPQGCQVASFKAPSMEELDHDYLWRCQRHLPERGRIGIFNRSYYEEVLVVRIHTDFLHKQRLPEQVLSKDIWKQRFREISSFEKHLNDNGTIVRKFFLHVSKKEQKKRFLERIDQPEKNWKFSSADVTERAYWKEYMDAYEDMIQHTSSRECPWFVVPADNKWFSRLIVSAAVIEALGGLDLKYPVIDKVKLAELADARKALLTED